MRSSLFSLHNAASSLTHLISGFPKLFQTPKIIVPVTHDPHCGLSIQTLHPNMSTMTMQKNTTVLIAEYYVLVIYSLLTF